MVFFQHGYREPLPARQREDLALCIVFSLVPAGTQRAFRNILFFFQHLDRDGVRPQFKAPFYFFSKLIEFLNSQSRFSFISYFRKVVLILSPR